ncbi:MAG: Rieske (2Fe-2S) protein, partial [Pseudomonadota bacterium]
MTSRVAELRESLGAIAGRPYSQAQALAGDYYTRNDWLEVEQRELFGNQWVCVGRVEEIDKPGDFMACRVGGEPVLLAHGEDGVIRALSNVCRHRGTTLMEGSGNSKSFICPYHHWTYDNTGDLIAAPSIKASDVFDPASC